MRCPNCSWLEDKVVDSRAAEDGVSIRRRRECISCGRRFTTFERLEEIVFDVVKRSGDRESFDRGKLLSGIDAAVKNRPVSDQQLEAIATEIEESMRLSDSVVTSQQIGVAVLEQLKALDEVAYLRFASVYKGFEDLSDFQKEVGLLTKSTEPKPHPVILSDSAVSPPAGDAG